MNQKIDLFNSILQGLIGLALGATIAVLLLSISGCSTHTPIRAPEAVWTHLEAIPQEMLEVDGAIENELMQGTQAIMMVYMMNLLPEEEVKAFAKELSIIRVWAMEAYILASDGKLEDAKRHYDHAQKKLADLKKRFMARIKFEQEKAAREEETKRLTF